MLQTSLGAEGTQPPQSINTADHFRLISENGRARKKWAFEANGQEHTLTNMQKEVLEHLLNSEAPNSITDLEEAGFTTSAYVALRDLEQTDCIYKYVKADKSSRAVYYTASINGEPENIPAGLEPYETSTRAFTHATRTSKPVSVTPEEKPLNPVRDVSAKHNHLPYIPLDENHPDFDKAVSSFMEEGKPGYEQASNGRYVWVGLDNDPIPTDMPVAVASNSGGRPFVNKDGRPVLDMLM